MTHEESLQFAKEMNKVIKKFSSLDFDGFVDFMEATELGWTDNTWWLGLNFRKMRIDFFTWWTDLDVDLQAKMVEHILNN